jgi:hypothetical protein
MEVHSGPELASLAKVQGTGLPPDAGTKAPLLEDLHEIDIQHRNILI